MSWAPFALAIVFGLLVSAGIYFTVMWPDVAPDDEAEDEVGAAPATVADDAAKADAPGDAAGGDTAS
ncbi:MAG: hypothetical protein K8W52_30220 [Deltaproteobacteria bacterium]|nr:hypothetical protein [Deltaproteobacteria bacterium]